MSKALTRICRAGLIALAAWTSNALAQESYIVEVVFFSQPGGQIAAAHSPDPDWTANAIDLANTARADVRPIDPSRHRLEQQAAQLSRQGYRVHLHRAWTQPAGADLTVAVEEPPVGGIVPVQGLVTLAQDRPLEVAVNFWRNHATGGDQRVVSEQLQQRRRLRLDETHYLDHQSLGMLVRVSRN
jgi:hypothetical protein